MLFPELNGIDLKGKEFAAPQSTTNQKSKDGVVAFTPQAIALRVQQQRTALIGSEPVAQSHTDPAHAFDSADAGRKLRAEQARISYFVRHTSDCRQSEVDRCRSEVPLFQVDSISKNNRAIESEACSEQYQSTNSLIA